MPGPDHRAHGARPQRRQFLRRDRAGRVPAHQHRRRASTSRTTRCCRAGCSPTSTPRCRGWARPTSTRSRSTRQRCPFDNFQRDGHDADAGAQGPRQLRAQQPAEAGEDGGPARDARARASRTLRDQRRAQRRAREAARPRRRRFADHYSQARLFFRSQTEIEQAHIASAFVFELSKVALEHVRAAHARAICATSTRTSPSASRTGLAMDLPPKNKAAKAPIDMKPSAALVDRQAGRHADDRAARSAILFDEGSDKAAIDKLKGEVEGAGGSVVPDRAQGRRAQGQGRHAQGRRPARGLALGAVRRGRAGARARSRGQAVARKAPRSSS